MPPRVYTRAAFKSDIIYFLYLQYILFCFGFLLRMLVLQVSHNLQVVKFLPQGESSSTFYLAIF